MTVAFQSALTAANLNGKLISRTSDQEASGVIDFVNGMAVGGVGIELSSGNLDIDTTSSLVLPQGTNAQRGTAVNGAIRYNTSSAYFEGYENDSWTRLITPAAGNRSYRAATTTDSITSSDDTVSYSGASFTATLFTAVGNAGKQITIIHNGTSLTQVYTLATTSSQTIGGIAGGSYVLYTNGETLVVESDGANWQIVSHKTNTEWIDSGAITVTATSSNPTKGTSAVDKLFWKRVDGTDVLLRYKHRWSTAGANGSGAYLFAIPANMPNIVTSLTEVSATAATASGASEAVANVLINGYIYQSSSSFGFVSGAHVYSTTQIVCTGYIALSAANYIGSALWGFGNANIGFDIMVRVPITGFQP